MADFMLLMDDVELAELVSAALASRAKEHGLTLDYDADLSFFTHNREGGEVPVKDPLWVKVFLKPADKEE